VPLSRHADPIRFATAAAVALLLGACGSEPGPSGVNTAPSAAISQPTTNFTFKGGDSIPYAGAATDDEDGAEPASRLSWWVVLHHDTHTHPFMPHSSGGSGKFFVPPIGETSDNIFLRLYLEAIDDSGAADTVTRDILPQKVQFTLATEPAGLSLTLDGQPQVTPVTITGVVGMERELGAITPQVLGSTQYQFSDWSDGGAGTHRIATPAAATTYTARFSIGTNRFPTVSLTAPSSGASVAANTTTTVTATAADVDGTVSKVGFYDGATLISEDQTSPYAAAWRPGTTGTHALTARATDNLGGTTTSTAVNVTVTGGTNRPPTVAITAPANGASLPLNNIVTITATASDPDGSIQRVRFYDGSTQLADDATGPYSTSWTPSSGGAHQLTAVAVDNLNASTTSAPVSITVVSSGSDTQAPTLTLTSPAAQSQGINGSPTFTVNAADNVGVTSVDYQVDGEQVGQATSPPWRFTLPATSVYTTGVHVIRAQARDAAGNRSGWASARVTFGGSTNLPSGFSRSIYVNQLIGQGTAMAWSPDGRLFICEQGGNVRVVKNGMLLSTPFVTVKTSVEGERGLLGVAFHPQFASNGWVYLYYTAMQGGKHNRISRFTANGDVARDGSEVVLVELPALSSATNHNGGALHFGPDGKLYVAVGDNATPSNSPSLSTVLGKLLRFNDDGSIPADNPFYSSTSGLNRSIWARGLRNPFTFAFEPGTGLMFINDVGQSSWEEIDVGRAGANYGWPGTEGATTAAGIDSPLFTYAHEANPTLVTGRAIVGGAFYRPKTVMFPAAWVGDYFFGDYVAGWINRLDVSNGAAAYAFARLDYLTDIQVGPDGALYVLAKLDAGPWGVYRFSR